MKNLTFILVIISLFYSFNAFSASVDLDVFYFSDTLKEDSNLTSTTMVYDIGFSTFLDRKESYSVGWNIMAVSQSQSSGSSTTTFSSMDMGPKFSWYFDKEKAWGVDIAYHIQSTASYSVSGASSTWRGSSIKFAFGYSYPLTDTMKLGLWLNYWSGTYPETLTGGTQFAKVSYQRTLISPVIRFSWFY